jgi:GST-like protein
LWVDHCRSVPDTGRAPVRSRRSRLRRRGSWSGSTVGAESTRAGADIGLGGRFVLTETLAIAEYVNTRVPSSGLIPVGGSERTRFWRWATFIVAAIYPTFTYGDSPGKWVANAEGRAQLRASTDSWRQKLFSLLEAECQSPYFLGDTFSAIDVYLAAMVHWRPRRPWFDTNAPRVAAVAGRIESRPELAELFAANFD